VRKALVPSQIAGSLGKLPQALNNVSGSARIVNRIINSLPCVDVSAHFFGLLPRALFLHRVNPEPNNAADDQRDHRANDDKAIAEEANHAPGLAAMRSRREWQQKRR
jgi:hypothetical protein